MLLQSSFAQHYNIYYVNADEKLVEKEMSICYLKIYKENAADTNYKRELYDRLSDKLLSTGQSLDEQGQIKDGGFKYFDKDGKIIKAGYYKNDKRNGDT